MRNRVSLAVKERILRHYLIPFSRSGLEPGIVRFLTPDKPIVLIDIGASSGEFTASVERYCGVSKALLAEPQARRVQELRDRFQDERFWIEECAISDSNGTAEMAILNFDYSSSLLAVKPEVGGSGRIVDLGVREKVQVCVRTLDGLLGDLGWSGPVDLLKLDVQGAELKALEGARATLATTHRVWTEVSFQELYEGAAVFSNVYDFMDRHSFRLVSLQEGFRGEGGELLQADALFVR